MYRMILAVIDGSDSSQSVVDQAIAMASAFQSNIHILHTGSSDEEQNTAPASPKDTGIQRVHETQITRASDLIKSAQQLAERFGIHISGTVHPKSDFLQSITNVASQVNCDLIMLGGDCPPSPGHAKYESLIGKLAQVATPPVLICKAHSAAEANVRQLHHWPLKPPRIPVPLRSRGLGILSHGTRPEVLIPTIHEVVGGCSDAASQPSCP